MSNIVLLVISMRPKDFTRPRHFITILTIPAFWAKAGWTPVSLLSLVATKFHKKVAETIPWRSEKIPLTLAHHGS